MPTAICIHVGKTESMMKTQVESETDERAGLHQVDGRQRAS